MESTEEARMRLKGNPQLHTKPLDKIEMENESLLKVCVRDERTLALSIMRCKQLRIVSLKTVNVELLKGCLRVYPIT